jgi:hypothetical protein
MNLITNNNIMNPTREIKIELNGWYGDRSALVKGELVTLQNEIKTSLTRTCRCKIDESRQPHIELTTKEDPKNNKAYETMDGRVIDVVDLKLWDITRDAIMLRCGVVNGKERHFTVAYSRDFKNHKRGALLDIIKSVVLRPQ